MEDADDITLLRCKETCSVIREGAAIVNMITHQKEEAGKVCFCFYGLLPLRVSLMSLQKPDAVKLTGHEPLTHKHTQFHLHVKSPCALKTPIIKMAWTNQNGSKWFQGEDSISVTSVQTFRFEENLFDLH